MGGRFENFTPPTLGSELTSAEITLIEALSALANSAAGEVLRKEGGVVVNSSTGSGTVTSVSVVTANGVSGSVATATTTPAITLTLGAITPSSVTSSGNINPATSDGAALGTTSLMWSDLFLASGAVINFNAGDVTISHGVNALTIAGGVVNFGSTPTVNSTAIYFVGGTDVALADGGTGASLADPDADRIMFWDDSLGAVTWLTAGSGLTITATTITATGTGISWSEVTGTSQTAAVNSGYICNNAALVTVTLADTAAVGDILRIVGKGAGLWRVAQNASENINFGNLTSTTGVGGYIEGTLQYDCVELVCTVANTTWTVMSSIGNITVV